MAYLRTVESENWGLILETIVNNHMNRLLRSRFHLMRSCGRVACLPSSLFHSGCRKMLLLSVAALLSLPQTDNFQVMLSNLS